jgi:uncharacterized surface anchored protein
MAPTDSADPQVGSLAGQVLDDSNEAPLAGAAIMVQSDAGQNPATTDAQGRFGFPEAMPGAYRVVATADGYRRNVVGVEVTAGVQAQVMLRLTPVRSG